MTAGTALVSVAAYSIFFGWWFAAGFVVLLFIHEMGHVIALRREGIKASAPMFIPFMGAVITARSLGDNALAEARVGLAGPILGTLGAAAVAVVGELTGSSLLIALTELGGSRTTEIASAGAVFCIATVAFVLFERRAAHPMVSFALWSHRPIAATNGVGVLASMALMGLTTFLPIYVQIVMQHSPVVAGLALTTVLIGWPTGATLAARLFHRYALRRLLLAGALLQPVGASIFVLLTPQSSPVWAAA